MSEPVLVCPKKPVNSRTLWINGIFIVVLVFLMIDEVMSKRGGFTAGFIALANAYLRFGTSAPITFRKGEEEDGKGNCA